MAVEIFNEQKYIDASNKALLFITSQKIVNKMKRLFLWIIPMLIWSTSCDKNVQVQEDLPRSGDVYVAGTVDGKAVLWKNGVAQNLTDETLDAEASSVFVSGNDVFVAGTVDGKAVLWKNGIAQNLSDGGANSVFVFGNDVYVAGYETNKQGYYVATTWSNGIAQNLTDGTSYAVAKSVFVYDGNVYVVGDERTEKDFYSEQTFAKVWKNGVVQDFFEDNKAVRANSVFVYGGNIYVAGVGIDFGYAAIVWENGIAQHLDGGYSIYSDAYANAVFVSGNDVYVAGRMSGRTHHYGKLWKNGEATVEYGETIFTSIYVTGEDCYVAGRSVGGFAILLKNGISQILAQGTIGSVTSANSIFGGVAKNLIYLFHAKPQSRKERNFAPKNFASLRLCEII